MTFPSASQETPEACPLFYHVSLWGCPTLAPSDLS